MAWSMLVFAFLFKIPDTSVQVPLVSVWAVIFVLFYASTGGTSPFVSRTDPHVGFLTDLDSQSRPKSFRLCHVKLAWLLPSQ